MISEADWRLFRAVRLAALAEAPYAFSTKLAEWQGAGDDEARWRARVRTVAMNAIAIVDDRPAGMVSATAAIDGTSEMISMWVAPWARRGGLGKALVQHAIAWARAREASRLVLCVYETNHAAKALYRREGFIDLPEPPCEGEKRMALALHSSPS